MPKIHHLYKKNLLSILKVINDNYVGYETDR